VVDETEEVMERAMREDATHIRDVDRIYEAFHGAAVRFGESRIKSWTMSNGRKIYYPASWDDEPERRTLSSDHERRSAERDRRIAEMRRELGSPHQAGNS
jgi:hypothetical protein